MSSLSRFPWDSSHSFLTLPTWVSHSIVKSHPAQKNRQILTATQRFSSLANLPSNRSVLKVHKIRHLYFMASNLTCRSINLHQSKSFLTCLVHQPVPPSHHTLFETLGRTPKNCSQKLKHDRRRVTPQVPNSEAITSES